jgi:hypothetical protein
VGARAAPAPADGPPGAPIDALLGALAGAPPGSRPGPAALAAAVAAAGGQDVVNLTAAIVAVARTHGTVLGPVPADRLADVWTLAVCHRLALSLREAFTSRDPSGATWRRFVTAWERAHLELAGYFRAHPRAFGPGAERRPRPPRA